MPFFFILSTNSYGVRPWEHKQRFEAIPNPKRRLTTVKGHLIEKYEMWNDDILGFATTLNHLTNWGPWVAVASEFEKKKTQVMILNGLEGEYDL